MPLIALNEFIAELDGVVRSSSPGRHIEMLRQVTELLLSCADRLSEAQVEVFDGVLVRLMQPVDVRTLARLSAAVAGLPVAPRDVIARLAVHDDATVAGPVLSKSSWLSEADLVDLAASRSQQHLVAIAGRLALGELLTDALLTRADTNICRELAKNSGARFSARGYSVLVAAAPRDDAIAVSLASRPDLPVSALHDLLAGSTSALRSRLVKTAPDHRRETIAEATAQIEAKAAAREPAPIDYSEAKAHVFALSKEGKLNDSTVNRFAVHGASTNLVAALALLATVDVEVVEPLVEEADAHGLMIACRASRLNWTTTSAMIKHRRAALGLPPQPLEQLREAFDSLNLSAAQRMIRFESIRGMPPIAVDAAIAGAQP